MKTILNWGLLLWFSLTLIVLFNYQNCSKNYSGTSTYGSSDKQSIQTELEIKASSDGAGEKLMGAPGIYENDNVVLTVEEEGIAYHWYRDSSGFAEELIASTTQNFLNLGRVDASESGNYWVTVEKSNGTEVSSLSLNLDIFSLDVKPRISNLLPIRQTIIEGAKIKIEVFASGSPRPTFQWYKNDLSRPIAGATKKILEIANSKTTHSGKYFVIATNENGQATSEMATVTVKTAVADERYDDIGNKRGVPGGVTYCSNPLVRYWSPDTATALRKCKEVNAKYIRGEWTGEGLPTSGGWAPYCNLAISRWDGTKYVNLCLGGRDCYNKQTKYMSNIRCFY